MRTTRFYRVRASAERSATNVAEVIAQLSRAAADGAPLPVSVDADGVHVTLDAVDPACAECGRPFEAIELASQVIKQRYRYPCPRCGRGVYVHDGSSSLAGSWCGRLELVVTDDEFYSAADGLVHCVRCDRGLDRAAVVTGESTPALEAHSPCPVHPVERPHPE
ncbi:MAG: hypothetical protein JWM74_1624, partial [Myxococcaceae bacterium]|nr:hypothetical protein [Myxococcaceae bacterium]